MTRYFIFIFIISACFINHNVHAQERVITKGNQQWVQYYNQTSLNKKYSILADGGFRWKDGFSENSQFIMRAGLRRQVAKNMYISAGMAYSGFYKNNELSKREYRPHQEFTLMQHFHKIPIQHRIRVEERFFHAISSSEFLSPDSFNFRFRYSLSGIIPLFSYSSKHPDKNVGFSIGDEIFLNAGASSVFDQNRMILGPVVKVNDDLSISLTWQSQFASTAEAKHYKYTDVIWLSLRHKLDLSSKNKKA